MTTKFKPRPIKPSTRIQASAWLWDNLYCTWRHRSKLPPMSTKDLLICCYTHYSKETEEPTKEPMQ